MLITFCEPSRPCQKTRCSARLLIQSLLRKWRHANSYLGNADEPPSAAWDQTLSGPISMEHATRKPPGIEDGYTVYTNHEFIKDSFTVNPDSTYSRMIEMYDLDCRRGCRNMPALKSNGGGIRLRLRMCLLQLIQYSSDSRTYRWT
jgi:hypothetical protein